MIGDEHGSLALRYRPRRFCDVAGQGPVSAVLYRMCYRGKVPSAMLFCGCHGTGKTSTARIVAAALNCKQEPGPAECWPCLECPSCRAVWAGSGLDVIEVDAASNGGKDEVKRLQEEVSYSSSGARRVVVLDEAHSMSRDAFNALLHLLEEPPPGVTFILATTERSKILRTVDSRCMPFRFTRLSPEVIAQRLAWICEQEKIPAEPDLLRAIAETADGALRDAVMSLDQMASVGIYDAARYRTLTGDYDFAPWLIQDMLSGDAEMFIGLDRILEQNGDFALVSARLVSCFKDLLVLLGGGQVSVQGEALETRRMLASRLDAARVGAAMRVLWELRTRAPRTEPRSALELAVKVCSEKLRPQVAVPVNGHAAGNGNGRQPMDIDALRALTKS